MSKVINGYQPESLFSYFEQISAIPRGSGNEEQIADFLCEWAEQHGIDCRRDAWNNVFMTAPATPGKEHLPAILLQGHTDMVCEKIGSSSHDFLTDPLSLHVKNGILTANGTTLGADDGIAVAVMMSALTENIAHPRLECLLTSDEERGMTGAQNFDYSQITATELLNLDSEEEGVATVSCAGGARIRMELPIGRMAIPQTGGVLSVKLTGLSGGHSGAEIHLEKGNANLMLARVLDEIYAQTPLQLISLRGGSKDNAIPRESEALFYTCEPEQAKETIARMEKILRAEATSDDGRLCLRAKKTADCGEMGMMPFADTRRILDALLLGPNGVLSRCPSDLSLVESSANLGVMNDREDAVVFTVLARSSVESRMDQLIARFRRLAVRVQAEMTVHDRYPGWQYREKSALRDDFLRIAGEVLGDSVQPTAAAIHAGLECGYILSAVQHDMDAISIGPAMKHIHTPDEALDLASCERLWKIVVSLLNRG